MKGAETMTRITNLVLHEKIKNIIKNQDDLKVYLKERNDKQDDKIDKNTIAIAGIKGASGVIAATISLFIAGISVYFRSKQ